MMSGKEWWENHEILKNFIISDAKLGTNLSEARNGLCFLASSSLYFQYKLLWNAKVSRLYSAFDCILSGPKNWNIFRAITLTVEVLGTWSFVSQSIFTEQTTITWKKHASFFRSWLYKFNLTLSKLNALQSSCWRNDSFCWFSSQHLFKA